MLYLGLELMSLALYVVAAVEPRQRQLDRSRPEVFRARRAVVGHAAVRRLADLRLHRHRQFRRHRGGAGRAAASASSSAWCSCSPGFASRSRRCRSTCGRPTSMRARRRRSPRSSPPRPKVAAHRDVHPRGTDRVPRHHRRNGSRSWCSSSIASMALGAFAAIGQTNIKRLMAYSSIGHMGFALVGLAAGTPEGVQGVLVYIAIYVGDDARHLRLHPGDAARRQAWSRISATSPACRAPTRRMAFFFAMLLFSLAGIPPLAGFFAKFYVFLAAIKAGLYTLAVIGVLVAAWSAPITICASSRSCISTSRRRASSRCRACCGWCWRSPAVQHPVLRLSGAAPGRCDGGGEVAV